MSGDIILASVMPVIGLIVIGASLAWMYFCYFPGGYKRSEVIDIGELAYYNAQMRAKEDTFRDKKAGHDGDGDDDNPGSPDFHQRALDSLYYEMEKGSAYTDGDATTDDSPIPVSRTWGSDSASEMDSNESRIARPDAGNTHVSVFLRQERCDLMG